LSDRLGGQQLKPERGNEFDGQSPPTLVKVSHDKVAAHYTRTANTWASVTPLVLPGFNDHKKTKTVKLIEKTLNRLSSRPICATSIFGGGLGVLAAWPRNQGNAIIK
jgi:CRISPR-associated protein, GSU0054 family (Cas_GSU0054)